MQATAFGLVERSQKTTIKELDRESEHSHPLTQLLPNLIEEALFKQLESLYEVHSFKHALEVLRSGCRTEYLELLEALVAFRMEKSDITSGGGNESKVPKKYSALLRPKG